MDTQAAYTHKTHEKQADICRRKYLRQRGWLVALTAVSSGTFVTCLVGVALDKQWAGYKPFTNCVSGGGASSSPRPARAKIEASRGRGYLR